MIKTQMNKYKLHRILLFLGCPTENETQCFSLWSKHNGNDSYSISRHFDKLDDGKNTIASSFIGGNLKEASCLNP